MKTSADVLIVGGGVVGVSAAYHLADAGAGSVLLLERADRLGTGSTGACAGGFRHQFGSQINVMLSIESIRMITSFTEDHGIPLDVSQDGYLFLVSSEGVWEEFLATVDMQRSFGVEVEVLTPKDAAELIPGISTDRLLGATFGPKDGIADPAGLTEGYATLARRAGADIETGVEARAIRVDGDRVAGVMTSRGEISSPVVVNAAGAWAGRLAATADLELPLDPIPRHVVVTAGFPGAPDRRTLVVDVATSFYFHREGPGVLMGMGSPREQPSFETVVDERFIADELLPTAVRVLPPLEEAGVRSSWVGLYEMTPDRHPILGEAPGVGGLFLATGFSGHGFQHAPVVGKLLTEMILQGEAKTVDVSSLGLDRFDESGVRIETHVI
ncbi:MAG TPA: FAD-binding oxidoreductase [Actinomycetota bacterium]|nr:FAD-binding oxidoreductase [Actinomycetota bacterium]